ncbi:ABC transporter permease [Actinomadura viridis]|uniref:Ribose transport system permease protein n=1 Tax=Actinomadura viridis TaxID=58110 RepID=A0A931DLV3_9ACTN|nr:ABC transporter permease [Actinomadura viridis]MBG6091059.1 ribose transport system permease protein [Actinomadura viridis]
MTGHRGSDTVSRRPAGEPPNGAPAGRTVRDRGLRDRVLRSNATLTPAALLLKVIQVGPLLMLLVIAGVFAVASPHFLVPENITNLGSQSSIVMALALGQFLVILIRGIDISVAAVVAFSAIVAVKLVGAGGSGVLFVLAMIAAGGLVGLVNGVIIVKGRLPQPLIVTVATLGVATGLSQTLTGGVAVVGLPDLVGTLGAGRLGPVPVPVVIVLGLGAVLYVVISHTQFGRWLYALGGNPEGAERMGLPTGGLTIAVYVLCGLTAGVAGLITAGQTDSATPLAGSGNILDAITAVVIGGTSLFGGRGSLLNVLVGALILGTIRNGLDLLNVNPYMQLVAIGVIIVVALELDVARKHLEDRVSRSQAGEVEA